MSEKIKITVVVHDEKANIEKAARIEKNMILTQDTSVTIMSVLLKNRLMDGNFCGGRGDCGRCVVQFLEGVPLPTGVERARLTPEELRRGYRLACMTRPKRDCVVKIVGAQEAEPEIVTEVKLVSESIDLNSQEKNLSENQKAAAMKSDTEQTEDSRKVIKKANVISSTEADDMKFLEKQKKEEIENNERYIIAVDLGTTTIAMQLRNMETGEVVDTYCELNPQRSYGMDVLSRIKASCDGHGDRLKNLVCEVLARGLCQFAAYMADGKGEGEKKGGMWSESGAAAGGQLVCMCVAGNTTMEHLLLGYDVETLGKAPFVPMETGLQTIKASCLLPEKVMVNGESFILADFLNVDLDFPVYIAPCISAFVGGDIVAGLYALRMLAMVEDSGTDLCDTVGKEGRRVSKTVLLIDLGTNGEMAITDGDRMIVTAAAAGPAFEGDGTLLGTDRIAFMAELLNRGILDETGLLEEPYFTEGVPVGTGENKKNIKDSKKNKCYFKQEDVRALQMAKAAVRAGVEILWEEMGRPEIEQVYLSGGFGYYLDVEAAVAIGLLPSRMRGRVLATGNTSLAGAYEMGRDLCKGGLDAALLEESLSSITSINLAQRENFEKLYLRYMNLEEN